MHDGPRVGADIGGTRLLLVALHRGGRELHRVPTGPGTGPEWIEREIRSFLARFDSPPAALGIALPCLVGWRADVAFADLDCPVRVLNEADAALGAVRAATQEPPA